MERGKMIVLCGIDGCGKSHIINALTEKGQPFEDYLIFKHPPKAWYDNPRIRAAYLDGEGEKIKDEDELPLVYDLRKQEEKEILIPQMLEQRNLLFHRYIFSLYAYYVGINKFSIEYLTDYYGDLLLPDKVIYLRISMEEFYVRFQHKTQLSYQKNPDYVRRVMDGYEKLAKMYNWAIVDTDKNTIDETVAIVKGIIADVKPDGAFYDLKKRVYNLEK